MWTTFLGGWVAFGTRKIPLTSGSDPDHILHFLGPLYVIVGLRFSCWPHLMFLLLFSHTDVIGKGPTVRCCCCGDQLQHPTRAIRRFSANKQDEDRPSGV